MQKLETRCDNDEERSVVCPECGTEIAKPADDTISFFAPGRRVVARFELLERLGAGRFGEVWSAKDPVLDRLVAIKIPRRDELTSVEVEFFLREARSVARLKHPYIVPVHEVCFENSEIFIVCDLVRGANLADWLTAHRPHPRQAAELCAKLADALHHAHQSGIVHRDLKPGNILMDRAGEPHIADFGLAKRDTGDNTISVEGRILGTPAYMPPEQARGDSHLSDARSDIYSLGVILYELLTGERPFRGNSQVLIQQVLNEEPRSPRSVSAAVPRDLETICLKAMAKSPSRRYQTAGELADDLRRVLNGEPILARRTNPVEHIWRSVRRHRLATLSSAIAIVAVITAAMFGMNAPAPPELPESTRTVYLTTIPPAARVVFYRLDDASGNPQFDEMARPRERTPVRLSLKPGDYLVVADLGERGFQEVFRRIPENTESLPGAYRHQSWKILAGDIVELPEIVIPSVDVTAGMTRFPGDPNFTVGAAELVEAPPHQRNIPAFFLDTHEMTVGEYRHIWPLPTAMTALTPSEHDPVHSISFDQALAFAERVGKRLPDEFEYEYAATLGGTRRFPWGDSADEVIPGWNYASIDVDASDRLPTAPPVIGLFSNLAEWTSSRFAPYPGQNAVGVAASLASFDDQRVVRGGSAGVIRGHPDVATLLRGPRIRTPFRSRAWQPGLGFRCARSEKPRLEPRDFSRVVTPDRLH